MDRDIGFASSSRRVREGQRTELEAELAELRLKALALGAAPSVDASPESILGIRVVEKKRAAA